MRKGFTLVELITVIIVIAVLAALALPQYTKVVERGQSSRAKAGLDTIRKAQGIYFALFSEYATNLANTNLTAEVPEIDSIVNNNPDWNFTLSGGNTTFVATATRQRGAYTGSTVEMNEKGVINVSAGYPF